MSDSSPRRNVLHLRGVLPTRWAVRVVPRSKKTGVMNFSGNAITLDGFSIEFEGSKSKKKGGS